ncbi:glycosyltransferase family 4 protein [Flavobacterium defluvii]|uniref:Glycosyltransferase involved in cell wall bisynthesis n=1 Tax=Flavobacterium defluvii TaxID=370979 RepID=A0A1M5NTA0_9FLAO|nr:glycosyltransferase [Flavobacterium defluvii]SHG92419.1 Glycosyltransferase involved in cell wall bisynthesis [Flavobacterium defluvii]
MKFAVITHVNHAKKGNEYLGYAPYVREMNIWLKYVDEVIIVAPLEKTNINAIDVPYAHDKIDFRRIPDFNFTSFRNNLRSLFKLPLIFWRIFWVMKEADHIHLRCPGNVGLIACFVQILFPKKIKTAKYAGNWDPKSKQPWTYRLQRWILNHPFLTKNIQVLVYGNWDNQSRNIKSFFTATYSESEKESIEKENIKSGINFIFTGSLVKGKNPLYAIKLIEALLEKGNDVKLSLYGEGIERESLENYTKENKLDKFIFFQGNQDKETLKKAYKKSHFVILPSKSEGWPKAIAEGMFWGCIPLATSVSCVPFMLDYGNRGVMLEKDLEKDIHQIEKILLNKNILEAKKESTMQWSQKYTTDLFDSEIKKILTV